MKPKYEGETNEQIAMKVSVNSIIVNITLSILKLFAGIFAHSGAMISDAVHSGSDVFSTFVVMAGVKISGRESDENHQYGHERLECVASIILAILLGLTGAGIGMTGVRKIAGGNYSDLQIPGLFALAAAIISIVVKEWMYWYAKGAAKRTDSGALMADAWHHRSDAMSSIGSLIGIAGARLGFPILDPVASVLICGFIIKAAIEIFLDAIEKMTDESCDMDLVNEMKEVVLKEAGVIGLDEIKTRVFGSKIYVDIEISADGNQTLHNAHKIAERVHLKIEAEFPKVKHCMVHVNPEEESADK